MSGFLNIYQIQREYLFLERFLAQDLSTYKVLHNRNFSKNTPSSVTQVSSDERSDSVIKQIKSIGVLMMSKSLLEFEGEVSKLLKSHTDKNGRRLEDIPDIQGPQLDSMMAAEGLNSTKILKTTLSDLDDPLENEDVVSSIDKMCIKIKNYQEILSKLKEVLCDSA